MLSFINYPESQARMNLGVAHCIGTESRGISFARSTGSPQPAAGDLPGPGKSRGLFIVVYMYYKFITADRLLMSFECS